MVFCNTHSHSSRKNVTPDPTQIRTQNNIFYAGSNIFDGTSAHSGVNGVVLRWPYYGLWWTYALDPAHRRDTDIMGDAAMYWVGGMRPPQPEQIDADGTLFFLSLFCVRLLRRIMYST